MENIMDIMKATDAAQFMGTWKKIFRARSPSPGIKSIGAISPAMQAALTTINTEIL